METKAGMTEMVAFPHANAQQCFYQLYPFTRVIDRTLLDREADCKSHSISTYALNHSGSCAHIKLLTNGMLDP